MKVCLITGASSGIGWTTALEFLKEGIAVVGVARSEEKLDALREAAGADADKLVTLAQDVTEDDAPANAVALAKSRFGRLDYLVNNAGIGSPKPVHETDDAFLDLNIDVMIRAPFRFAREALTIMESGSSVVNVASTYALVGGLRGGAYSVAKAGILGLTSHMACQYGSAGIRCNAIAPGVIPTPMVNHRLEDEGFKRMNYDLTPANAEGWGTTEDVASVILFLCSDRSKWVNGQVIAVDGGWSATKFMTESALTAERTMVSPGFSHSGKTGSA